MRPVFLLVGGVIAGLVAARIRSGILRSLHTAEERRRIVQMFGQHVSPAVVHQLLAQPSGIQSELRDVCILVLDIRDFTAFAETAAPDAIVGVRHVVRSRRSTRAADPGQARRERWARRQTVR